MVQPIVSLNHYISIYPHTDTNQNVIFKNLQQVCWLINAGLFHRPYHSDSQRTKVSIWLYDNIEMRIEGRIIVRIPVHIPARRHSPALIEAPSAGLFIHATPS